MFPRPLTPVPSTRKGAERSEPETERRRFCHRDRRQRCGKIHPAECGGRRVAGGRRQDPIDGVDVTRLGEHQRAAYIGRVFQDPMTGTAATMQIEENLALA